MPHKGARPPSKSQQKLAEVDSKTSNKSTSSMLEDRCTICLTSFSKPAKLSCGHRFCEDCLGQYWYIYDKKDHIICPLCRSYVSTISFWDIDEPVSLSDFRKMFRLTRKEAKHRSQICTILGFLVPMVYYVLTWSRDSISNYLQSTFQFSNHSTGFDPCLLSLKL